MPNLPVLHERFVKVNIAEREMSSVLLDLRIKHELTTVEYLQFLNEEAQRQLKHLLRSERHPDDPHKPADEQ